MSYRGITIQRSFDNVYVVPFVEKAAPNLYYNKRRKKKKKKKKKHYEENKKKRLMVFTSLRVCINVLWGLPSYQRDRFYNLI